MGWAEHTALGAAELMPGFLELKALLAASPPLFFAEIVLPAGEPDGNPSR